MDDLSFSVAWYLTAESTCELTGLFSISFPLFLFPKLRWVASCVELYEKLALLASLASGLYNKVRYSTHCT